MTTAGPPAATALGAAALDAAMRPPTAAAVGQQPAAQAHGARRGAGGRWLVWLLRPLVWAILLVIGYQGVASIAESYFTRGTGSGGQQAGFPVALAQAYAVEFGQVYLNFNPATAARRATALAAFLPPGADPEFGWDGIGTQSALAVQVAGIRVLSAHRAVVTLLARVNGHLIELGVPVYAAGGGLIVSGKPALLPPPAAITPPSLTVARDPATRAALSPRLAAFFRAFASGDPATLRGFLVSGARIDGLGGLVGFGGVAQVTVPAAGGATREIVVTVKWRVPGQPASGAVPSLAIAPAATSRSQLEMTYAMTVVRRGGTWYVRSLGAAAGPEAAP